MKNTTRLSLIVVFLGTWLSACDSGQSSSEAAGPEAYEYKGAADPLLSVSGADRAGGLADRFDLVQGRQ